MFLTCAEEGRGIHQQKVAHDKAARKEEKKKTKEEIHGRGLRGHADSWYERKRCKGKGEKEDEDML